MLSSQRLAFKKATPHTARDVLFVELEAWSREQRGIAPARAALHGAMDGEDIGHSFYLVRKHPLKVFTNSLSSKSRPEGETYCADAAAESTLSLLPSRSTMLPATVITKAPWSVAIAVTFVKIG